MEVSGKQMHLKIQKGDVGKYCIVPGDPGRCEKIAALLENPRFVAQNREFTVYTRSEERRVGKECRSRWSPYH